MRYYNTCRYKYKKLLQFIKILFYNNTCYSNIVSLSTASLLNERLAELPENSARQVLGFHPSLGMQQRWLPFLPSMS